MEGKRGLQFPHIINSSEKKGSHVGMIASFAIFVVFIIALYIIVQPTLNTQRDKTILLELLETKLISEFKSNLTIAIINTSLSQGVNCIDANRSEIMIDKLKESSIVKDKSNNIINSGLLTLNQLIINSTNEKILWIYSSKEFSSVANVLPGCIYPKIESVRTEQRIFQSRIINYTDNFDNNVKSLNLPSGSSLGLAFTMSNKTIISIGNFSGSSEIYVKEIPIQYIDEKANDLTGMLAIKIN